MNAQQFFQYIEHPDKLGIHEEVQLRGVLKEFPYFQSAQILLAKCLKNMDNYTFEKQLRMAAVFSSNRAVMYQLLKSGQRNEPSVIVPHQVASEAPVAKPAQLIPQPMDEPESEKPVQPILQSVLESLDEEDEIVITEPESIKVPEIPIAKPEPLEFKAKPEMKPIHQEKTIEETDHLAQRRIEIAEQYEAFLQRKAALSGVPMQTLPSPVASPEPESDIQSTPLATEENVVVAVIMPEAPVAYPPESVPVMLEMEVTDESETTEALQMDRPAVATFSVETHSFSEWLNMATSLKQSKEITTSLKEQKPEIEAEASAREIEIMPVSRVSREEIDAILERFIHQNPSISRPKSEFFNPVKAAQKSLEDSGELVTETLARMNEKQGNYQKAITIYEKLSLKFPDKASIFAALITELKHKIN